MAEYYNKFYKHPLNGYDPKYFMIPHRCAKCYYLWNKKKPIYDCDFFVNFRRKITLYTVVRKYRKKSVLELLADRIESLEKRIEEMYNDINRK